MPAVVDPGGDVFTPGDPPRGVCFSPTDATLEEDVTWVRLDDPQGYRLAAGFTITRGRSSETDAISTGAATINFVDTEGILDPTNTGSPFAGNLDPMKQASIALMNPTNGDWSTLFRGFIGSTEHQLDMFTSDRGVDEVVWNLVDAHDIFSNIVLTHGKHGSTPALTGFPNIWYPGTPSNVDPDEPAVEVHVDDRIIALLDDAGWPGTGQAFSLLRNIFSGNVTVQGTVMARLDSLMSGLRDACEAEFPGGVSTMYVSKDGVVSFRGRYARFFPDNPGYGINHWFAGSIEDAAADPTIAPLSGPLHSYRTKDDIINACMCLAQNVDESDPGVDFVQDTDSIAKYGYRNENFEGLIVHAGHDDDNNPTTETEEANKYAQFYVTNFAEPKTRVGTLRFVARGADSVGAEALWALICGVELGDTITLTTPSPGGSGGFDERFFVEQIRITASPASETMHSVVCELEVSPETYFAYNPFNFTGDPTVPPAYEDAVRLPGALTAWWRLGDTFTFASSVANAMLDTADFDIDSPRNLTYAEASSTGRPTLQVTNATLDTADDGAVELNSASFTTGQRFYNSGTPVTDVTQFGTTANQARTVSVWLKVKAGAGALYGPVVGRWGMDGAGSVNLGWVLEVHHTTYVLRMNVNASSILTGPTLTPGTWIHVAVTFDGTTWTMYVDGLFVDDMTAGTPTAHSSGHGFAVGYGIYDTGITEAIHLFYGSIDDVAFYNRVLTPAEILVIYAAGTA